MSESVEQAALRRAGEGADWKRRAEREAVAVLDAVGYAGGAVLNRDTLVALLAATWLQGFSLGAHDTLSRAEVAFENVRAAL